MLIKATAVKNNTVKTIPKQRQLAAFRAVACNTCSQTLAENNTKACQKTRTCKAHAAPWRLLIGDQHVLLVKQRLHSRTKPKQCEQSRRMQALTAQSAH
jgi:hypothetical protein